MISGHGDQEIIYLSPVLLCNRVRTRNPAKSSYFLHIADAKIKSQSEKQKQNKQKNQKVKQPL